MTYLKWYRACHFKDCGFLRDYVLYTGRKSHALRRKQVLLLSAKTLKMEAAGSEDEAAVKSMSVQLTFYSICLDRLWKFTINLRIFGFRDKIWTGNLSLLFTAACTLCNSNAVQTVQFLAALKHFRLTLLWRHVTFRFCIVTVVLQNSAEWHHYTGSCSWP